MKIDKLKKTNSNSFQGGELEAQTAHFASQFRRRASFNPPSYWWYWKIRLRPKLPPKRPDFGPFTGRISGHASSRPPGLLVRWSLIVYLSQAGTGIYFNYPWVSRYFEKLNFKTSDTSPPPPPKTAKVTQAISLKKCGRASPPHLTRGIHFFLYSFCVLFLFLCLNLYILFLPL